MDIKIICSSDENFQDYINRVASPSTWEQTVIDLVSRLGVDESPLIFKLLDFCLEISQDESHNYRSKALLPTIVHGFRLLHDRGDQYVSWLEKLRDLFHNEHYFKMLSMDSGKEADKRDPFQPTVVSFIGAICMIFYIERFLNGLSIRNTAYDSKVHPLENALVQLVAGSDSSYILFPLSFIGSHLMDISAVSAQNTSKNLNQVAEFMKNFFAIHQVTFLDISVSVNAMNQWRALLSFENKICPNNIIFINGIFTENCSVSLNMKSSGFVKNMNADHSITSHLQSIISNLPTNENDQYFLVKYLIWTDCFFGSSKPTCCKPGYTIGLSQSQLKPIIFNYILNCMIEFKSSFALERFSICLGILNDFIRNETTTQEELSSLVENINDTTWKGLWRDMTQSANYFPILEILIDYLFDLDGMPFSNPINKKLNLTWHRHIVSTNNTGLLTILYLKLLEKKEFTSAIRTSLLQLIEAKLSLNPSSSTQFQSARSQFLDFLQMLRNDTCPIPSKTTIYLKMAYFDLILIAYENKKSLFRLCTLIHYQSTLSEESTNIADEDIEEGEEIESAVEEMTDVAAAHYFFSASIDQFFPDYSRIKAIRGTCPSVSSENILLPTEIFKLQSLEIEKNKELIDLFVEYWKSVGITIPAYAFRSSIHSIFNLLGSNDEHLLIRVYVQYLFSSSWAMKEYFDLILNHVGANYSKTLSLVLGFKDILKNFGSTESNPHFAYVIQFLKDVLKSVAVQLAWLKIPNQVPKFNRKKSADESSFAFFSTPGFPKSLLAFLSDCLSSCPESIMLEFFQSLVHEMKLDRVPWLVRDIIDANIYEVVFVAIYLHAESHLLKDVALKCLLLEENQNEKSFKFSEMTPKLTMAHCLVQDFLVDSENFSRSIPKFIQETMLSRIKSKTEANKKLFVYFKESILTRIIPFKSVFLDCWFSPLFQSVSRDENCFGYQIVLVALSTQHDFWIGNPSIYSLLFDFFSQQCENPIVQPLFQYWIKWNKESKSLQWKNLLMKYADTLPLHMKASLEQIFLDVISPSMKIPNASKLLLEKQLQEESTNFFLPLLYKSAIYSKTDSDSFVTNMIKHLQESASQITCELCAVLVQSTKTPATLQQFRKLVFFFESLLEVNSSLFSCLLLDDSILFSMTLVFPTLKTKESKWVLCLFIKYYGLLGQQNLDIVLLEKIDQQWSFFLSILSKHCLHPSKPTLIPLFFQLVDFLADVLKALPTSKVFSELRRIASLTKVVDDYWIQVITKHLDISTINLPLMLKKNQLVQSAFLLEFIEKWVDQVDLSKGSGVMCRYFIIDHLLKFDLNHVESSMNILMKLGNKLELLDELDLLIRRLKENPGYLQVMISLFQTVLAKRGTIEDGEKCVNRSIDEELKSCLVKYQVDQSISKQCFKEIVLLLQNS